MFKCEVLVRSGLWPSLDLRGKKCEVRLRSFHSLEVRDKKCEVRLRSFHSLEVRRFAELLNPLFLLSNSNLKLHTPHFTLHTPHLY